jgi:hypothetical protein
LNTPKYNIIHAFVNHKWPLLGLFLLCGITLLLTKNSNIALLVAAIYQCVFLFYLLASTTQAFKVVRDYIAKNEPEINKRYRIQTGFGYNSYFRNFSTEDYEKLCASSVNREFKVCNDVYVDVQLIFISLCVVFVAIGFA